MSDIIHVSIVTLLLVLILIVWHSNNTLKKEVSELTLKNLEKESKLINSREKLNNEVKHLSNRVDGYELKTTYLLSRSQRDKGE